MVGKVGSPFWHVKSGNYSQSNQCEWCGNILKYKYFTKGRDKHYRDDIFCSIRCGYQWACERVDNDNRYSDISMPLVHIHDPNNARQVLI